MQMKSISYTSGRPPSLLRKAGAIVATVALASLALMFSAVLLVVFLVAVMIGGAYLWWKTREARKLMREMMRGFPPGEAVMQEPAGNDSVFEGKVIRVVAADQEID